MKTLTSFLIAMFIALTVTAQVPRAFKYQAVARDASGNVLANRNVNLKISIIKGTISGTVVYSEVHSATTNFQGLLNLEIGQGSSPNGTFSSIPWGTGPYFVKVELDPNGGTAFQNMGTSQLLSVPYAMYAEKTTNLDIPEASRGDLLFFDGSKWSLLKIGNDNQVLKITDGNLNWYPSDLPVLPLVTTNNVAEITQTTATCGGLAMANGNTEIIIRGVCWSLNQNPTVKENFTQDGTGLGDFTSTITGLTAGKTYYVRAYATNSSGTSYGNQVSFKSVLTVVFPTVITSSAINITANSAASGGNVTATGGADVIAKGICWSTNLNPTVADSKTDDGSGSGQFNSQMKNLQPGTKYYVRAYATNIAGTGYGSQVDLTSLKTPPVVMTKSVISISPMGGVSGGTITQTGGGTISNKGICWSEEGTPTINDDKISAGNGTAAYNSAISMLKPNSTCYVRAYAVNEIGIAYGEQKTFKTLNAFYDGFETGFSGSTGGWGIVTGNAIEGAYSLQADVSGSEATLKRTLTIAGQITFYIKLSTGANANVTFYIDNVAQGTYSNTFWGLQSYPVQEGEHTFKWKYSEQFSYWSAWIDFIVMPK